MIRNIKLIGGHGDGQTVAANSHDKYVRVAERERAPRIQPARMSPTVTSRIILYRIDWRTLTATVEGKREPCPSTTQ